MILIRTVLVCILLVESGFAANILHIAPVASPSHYAWNKALSLALVEMGHNVTIVTHDSEENITPENYTVITLEGLYDVLDECWDYDAAIYGNALDGIKNIFNYVKYSCEYALKTKQLESLLEYPRDMFDLIIIDNTFHQCFYPLIKEFNNPPVVAVTALLLPPSLSYSFGNHLYTSYMPYYYSEFTNHMSFTQRLLNFIYINAELLYRNLISTSNEYELAKKRFGEEIDKFEDVERNISLLLANIDPNLDYPIPLPPNIIPVGGLHLKPSRPLQKDIKQIVDTAPNGVILFSLGTNILFSMLNPMQKVALFTALAKLPQTILWKIEIDNPVGIPKNVIARKWFPQNDILGHPNTKLFITHGGALGVQETVYHGVPVVVIPFILDQYVNSRKLVAKKLGRHLDHANLTAENVYDAIKDVLENPIYSQNMKLVSRRYRDQPQTAIERGVFWIEYVLKHKHARHLVIPARDMPFYKIANLDVLSILGIGLFCIYNFIMLVLTTLRFMVSYLCGRNVEKIKRE